MKLFRKLKEYNNLAKAFNGHYQMLHQWLSDPNTLDVQGGLYELAYLGRKEIVSRMEEYQWNMNGRIVVPMMPGEKKTLAYAYQETIWKLLNVSEELGYYKQVKEILDGGELYQEIDQDLPEHFKKIIF